MILFKKIEISLLLIFFYLYFSYIKKTLPFQSLINNLKGIKNKKILIIDTKTILSLSKKLYRFFNIKNCFTTAMVVYYILKLCDKNPKFFIGTCYKKSIFISHAWIEVEGMIFDTNKQDIRNLKKIIKL